MGDDTTLAMLNDSRCLDCFGRATIGNQTERVMKSFRLGHQGLLCVEVIPPSEEGWRQLATLRDMRLEIKVWLLSLSYKASAVLIHVFQLYSHYIRFNGFASASMLTRLTPD